MTEEQFRNAVAYQRILGMAQVGVMLDEMCRSYGWDPVMVWRVPNLDERLARAVLPLSQPASAGLEPKEASCSTPTSSLVP